MKKIVCLVGCFLFLLVSSLRAQESAQILQYYANIIETHSAEQDNTDVLYRLGVCYYTGSGVPKNLTEAVKWYRKAAEHGHVDAQHSLGVCYAKGSGVAQNLTEAIKWFRLAANQGHANAQLNIGRAYAKGIGIRQDRAEAIKWMRLAAEQGWPSAQSELNALLQGETKKPAVWSNWRQADRQAQAIVQKFIGQNEKRPQALQYRVSNDGWYRIKFKYLSFGSFVNDELEFRINPDGSIEDRMVGESENQSSQPAGQQPAQTNNNDNVGIGAIVLSNWRRGDRQAQVVAQKGLGFDDARDVRVSQYRVGRNGNTTWYIITLQFRSFNNRFSPSTTQTFRVNPDGSVDSLDW